MNAIAALAFGRGHHLDNNFLEYESAAPCLNPACIPHLMYSGHTLDGRLQRFFYRSRHMPEIHLIKAGDVVEIKEGARSMQRYKDIVEVTGGRLVPEWMDVDIEGLKGSIKNLPTREMIDVPVDEMLIVELYSK